MCKTDGGCTFGGSGLGSRNKEPPPGKTAAEEILRSFSTGASIDEHMQDQVSSVTNLRKYFNLKFIALFVIQIIILMALAKGTSKIRVGNKLTCHTETAMQVAEIMLNNHGLRFNLSKSSEKGSYILECQGCGLINDN